MKYKCENEISIDKIIQLYIKFFHRDACDMRSYYIKEWHLFPGLLSETRGCNMFTSHIYTRKYVKHVIH